MRCPPTLVLLLVLAAPAGAQQWTGADSLPLIGAAIAERDTRDTDLLLRSWQATARGVLRFASVIEHGGYPVERVIKLDELQVEVYGEAPNRSKQVIAAWRDTTLLPNQIVYHRDHLGIVAHDFGPIVRLGDGEEVRDVPHPLSAVGAGTYLFAAGDTLRIGSGPTSTRVIAVAVRPADPGGPGAVGTLYIDLDRSALVRFRFTFTAASYRDPSVEEITVSLENALQDGKRWLPWRQSIVIRRGTSWLDLPVRTVIRADWTIDDYQLGVVHPAQRFAGAPIAGLRRPGADSVWELPIAAAFAGLPTITDGVDEARRAAVRAIGEHLAGLPRARASADGVSGIVSVNRVQGLRVSPGIGVRGPGNAMLRLSAGAGSADRRLVGSVRFSMPVGELGELSIGVARTVRDVSDDPIISGLLNSARTLVGGDDRLDWYGLDRIAAVLRRRGSDGSVQLEVAHERVTSLETLFPRSAPDARMNPSMGPATYSVVRGAVAGRELAGAVVSVRAEVASGSTDWARIDVVLAGSRPMLSGIAAFRGWAAAGTSKLPVHRSLVLGGRGTLPGVDHRTLGGRRALWGEVSWLAPIALPVPRIPVARHVPLPSALGVFFAAGAVGDKVGGAPWQGSRGVHPVFGVRVDLWGPLLRIDAGVALRTGSVAITFDAHPDWWPIL